MTMSNQELRAAVMWLWEQEEARQAETKAHGMTASPLKNPAWSNTQEEAPRKWHWLRDDPETGILQDRANNTHPLKLGFTDAEKEQVIEDMGDGAPEGIL